MEDKSSKEWEQGALFAGLYALSKISDSRIGWVQLPGSAPDEVQAKNTTSYGVGAYLLAGSELYKFLVKK
ncbi:hypothetical protein GF337_03890 [candidate division KSB1 bacterium]|nr:hypothetical protein [candidate division KSB1 bacterium]